MTNEKFKPTEVARRLYPGVVDRLPLGYASRLYFCENEAGVVRVMQYFIDNEEDILAETE